MTETPKKLFRSKQNKMISGVCAGIAEYANLDPNVVRIIFIVGSLMTGLGPGIIAYVAIILLVEEK